MTASCCNLDMDSYNATRAEVERNPEAGQGSFETLTEWRDGAQAVTRARSFTLETDEPAALGGRDQHIDPMELLLASLGTCLTIGWVTHANAQGVDFRDLKVRVSAPFDLRGYLGIDKGVRPGFGELSYTIEVDTDADAAILERIRTAAERHSPIFDNIFNATLIRGEVRQTGKAAA